GPLPPERAAHLLRQLCGALAEAHGAGLIHRDIKPGNIIVGEGGGRHDLAKLLDFGLVRSVVRGHSETRLTQDGALAGTPAFMSPEQAAGRPDLDARRAIDPRGDICRLAGLAYLLLTGQPPCPGESAVRVLAAHLYEAPVPLTDRGANLPAELQRIVLRCLAKDPAERFQDVGSLELALAR